MVANQDNAVDNSIDESVRTLEQRNSACNFDNEVINNKLWHQWYICALHEMVLR